MYGPCGQVVQESFPQRTICFRTLMSGPMAGNVWPRSSRRARASIRRRWSSGSSISRTASRTSRSIGIRIRRPLLGEAASRGGGRSWSIPWVPRTGLHGCRTTGFRRTPVRALGRRQGTQQRRCGGRSAPLSLSPGIGYRQASWEPQARPEVARVQAPHHHGPFQHRHDALGTPARAADFARVRLEGTPVKTATGSEPASTNTVSGTATISHSSNRCGSSS